MIGNHVVHTMSLNSPVHFIIGYQFVLSKSQILLDHALVVGKYLLHNIIKFFTLASGGMD